MARQRSQVAMRTVYELTEDIGQHGLESALRYKAVDERVDRIVPVSVDTAEGLLAYGSSPGNIAAWCSDVKELTGENFVVRTQSASAVLLLKMARCCYAVSFGNGRFFLRPECIAERFGLKVAIRALNPEEVTQITRTIMDVRGQTDRSTASNGQTMRDYGIGGFGELVPKVSGKSRNLDISAGSNSKNGVQLNGSESLKIPLGRSPKIFVQDLDKISQVVETMDVPDEHKFIDEIVEVNKNSPEISLLQDKLVEAIFEDDGSVVAISRPWMLDDYEDEIDSYKCYGRKSIDPSEMSLDIIREVARVPQQARGRLDSQYVTAHRDDGSLVPSGRQRLCNWLTAEMSLHGSRYFLQGGSWYRIGSNYASEVESRVKSILARPCPVNLPAWSDGSERDYNLTAAAQSAELTCLDRVLIQSDLHRRRGVESCDLLGPSGELVHVKGTEASWGLSHLFNQGMVAAEQLREEDSARQALARRIQGAAPNWVEEGRPAAVVFAIKLKKTLSVENFFSFSKVTLLRTDQHLARLNVQVSVTDLHPQRGS
jgi:uncharacterized protein (TIGR04141 family)